jgi:hypothetical protein
MPGNSQYRRKRRLSMSRNIRQDPLTGNNPHERIDFHLQHRPKPMGAINQKTPRIAKTVISGGTERSPSRAVGGLIESGACVKSLR